MCSPAFSDDGFQWHWFLVLLGQTDAVRLVVLAATPVGAMSHELDGCFDFGHFNCIKAVSTGDAIMLCASQSPLLPRAPKDSRMFCWPRAHDLGAELKAAHVRFKQVNVPKIATFRIVCERKTHITIVVKADDKPRDIKDVLERMLLTFISARTRTKKSLVFLFFNGEYEFTVDGKVRELAYDDRLLILQQWIDYVPTKQLEFVCLFYPVEAGVPRMLSDPDFPPELKPFGRCVY